MELGSVGMSQGDHLLVSDEGNKGLKPPPRKTLYAVRHATDNVHDTLSFASEVHALE
jgi:hypothetical protein